MSIVIRQYKELDFASVMKLHIEGLKQFGANINDPSLDKDMNNIKEHYIDNDGEFLVGLVNDEIIGMGAYRKKSDEVAEIKRIRIEKDHQKKGYGEYILHYLEKSAMQKGYNTIILDTTSNQVPARRLFIKNHYNEVKRKIISDIEIIFYEKDIRNKNLRM